MIYYTAQLTRGRAANRPLLYVIICKRRARLSQFHLNRERVKSCPSSSAMDRTACRMPCRKSKSLSTKHGCANNTSKVQQFESRPLYVRKAQCYMIPLTQMLMYIVYKCCAEGLCGQGDCRALSCNPVSMHIHILMM